MKLLKVFDLRLSFLIILIMVLMFPVNCNSHEPKAETITKKPQVPASIFIDDFDKCASSKNCLNGTTGSYHHPGRFEGNDLRESYNETVVSSGCALKLAYDVTARKGFVGYWSKLKGADFSRFKKLVLSTKGDPEEGFTTRFKLELKPFGGGTDFYVVTRITAQWEKIEIPLHEFGNPQLLKSLEELVITFAPDIVSEGRKKGVIYIDNIYVE